MKNPTIVSNLKKTISSTLAAALLIAAPGLPCYQAAAAGINSGRRAAIANSNASVVLGQRGGSLSAVPQLFLSPSSNARSILSGALQAASAGLYRAANVSNAEVSLALSAAVSAASPAAGASIPSRLAETDSQSQAAIKFIPALNLNANAAQALDSKGPTFPTASSLQATAGQLHSGVGNSFGILARAFDLAGFSRPESGLAVPQVGSVGKAAFPGLSGRLAASSNVNDEALNAAGEPLAPAPQSKALKTQTRGRVFTVATAAVVLASLLAWSVGSLLFQNPGDFKPDSAKETRQAQLAPSAESLIHEARTTLEGLKGLKGKDKLDRSDQALLDRYAKFFNATRQVKIGIERPKPDDPEHPTVITVEKALSIDSLNAVDRWTRDQVLERLHLALNARAGATMYRPRELTVGGRKYLVHNAWAVLRPKYTAEDLRGLIRQLENKGVFKVHTDPKTGLVRTADTANARMLRQWFTDGSMNGLMQRVQDPESWKKVIIVHAAILNTKKASQPVEEAVRDLNWYRSKGYPKGIEHVFYPESIRWDAGAEVPDTTKMIFAEFDPKRVESFGLLLGDFVDTLRVGMIPDAQGRTQRWGFSPKFMESKQPFSLVKTATVNLVRYLVAIHTDPKTGKFDMAAPSSSSWEEAPFPGGMTSDTGFVVLAFEKLRDLMHNPAYNSNKAIRRLRQELAAVPGGEILRDKEKLDRFISAGRKKVEEGIVNPLNSGEMPMQNPQRKPDTSLVLLAASNYTFDSDPVRDAGIRLRLLRAMKRELMGDYGMRRYNEFTLHGASLHDSYLNINFHIPVSLRETILRTSKNAKDYAIGQDQEGDPFEYMKGRQVLSSAKYAAQWGLGVSATLQGLVHAKTEVLRQISSRRGKAPQEELQLLAELNQEIHEFINRNVALISGRLQEDAPVIRADGTPNPDNGVMEAYQVISDLSGEPRWVPGTHVLAWGTSQLFNGLHRAQRAQELEEDLERQGKLSGS